MARIDKKGKSIVSCYHMNCCQQKYTTHLFTYFIIIYMNCCLKKYTTHLFTYLIYYLFQDNFITPKMM